MATVERKRVTLHPLKEDGTIDPKTCLYPKTFIDGIVDREGKEVDIQEKLIPGENITIEDNVISAIIKEVDAYTKEEADEKFAAKAEVEQAIEQKQDILISGENIKTINNESILGSGNIELNFVDTTSDQNIEGDKTFENITIHNDTAVFNGEAIIRGNLLDQEGKVVPLKELSFANNLENGAGNGSLIQTNVALTSVEWSSSDESIAIVDEDGNIEAVGVGEATITAIKEGAEATCNITISPRLRGLRSVSTSSIELDEYDFITSLDDISSDDEIYLIAPTENKQFNGQIEGTSTKYGGQADIVSGEDLIAPLTFTKIPDTENEYTISTVINDTIKYLYWSSGNSLNAGSDVDPTSRWLISFDGNNAILLNKAGADENRKLAYNSGSPRFACYTSTQKAVALVKKSGGPTPVIVPVESIELSDSTLELESGETYTLTADVGPEDATEKGVNWSSSNLEVISVDSDGNLTAGLLNVTSTATITATTQGETEQGEHLSATCIVTVEKQHGPAIRLSASHLSLRVGDTAKLTAKYVQTNVADGDLAVALGHSNAAHGDNSVTIGSELISNIDNQIVIGKYNINKSDTIFEVGNGNVDNRSNALEVYTDGSVRVYKAPTNNNDIVNKSYIDSSFVNLSDNQKITGKKRFTTGLELALEENAGLLYNSDYTLKYNHGDNFLEAYYFLPDKPSGDYTIATTDDIYNNGGLEEITWADLKTKRDNSELIPGKHYRITDYTCTTTQTDTSSAGHVFDIIVVADDVNKLNENARAYLHSSDTYFSTCKLGTWQLKYCLDNDTNRFAWADTIKAIQVSDGEDTFIFIRYSEGDSENTYAWIYLYNSHNKSFEDILNWESVDTADLIYTDSEIVTIGDELDMGDVPVAVTDIKDPGKGVIYYMKDEFSNECPYDFKNILFTSSEKYTSAYTFNYRASSTNKDASLLANKECYNNIIKEYINNNKLQLNFNVFYSTSTHFGCFSNTIGTNSCSNTFGSGCYSNTFSDGCYSNNLGSTCFSNSFGSGCYSNTSGTSFHDNTIGNDCYSNTFSSTCYKNTFGNNCCNNAFGNICCNNSFGSGCYSNTLGNSFTYNHFGNTCTYNSFGNNCSHNLFANTCSNNTFENQCYYNSFGNHCSANTIGNDCSGNSFGNGCYNNTFGNQCSYNLFSNDCKWNAFGHIPLGSSTITPIDYVEYITLENGCSYLYIISSDTTASASNYLQNVHIHEGIRGISTNSRKTITIEDRGLPYSVDIYAPNSKTIILDEEN